MLKSISRSPSLRLSVKRLLQSIPVLWGVTFITFCLLNLLPGDAAQALLGVNATPEAIKELRLRLHLNEPFFVRYWHWLSGAVHMSFGDSLSSGQPVSTILGQRAPVTFELIVLGFLISVVLAIPIASLAARRPGGAVDRASIGFSMVGLSVPGFVIGLVLILIFAVHARVLPAIGFVPLSQGFGQNIRSMVLPSVTLAIPLLATYTRLLRADMVDQLVGEDYVMTARSKGVAPRWILLRHALRNSLFGLITLIGLNFGTLIGGTVIIESIFALPGMGQELIQAIGFRDIIVVEAIVTVISVVVVASNLLADLLYAVLDPRIRYGARTS